MTKAIKTTIAWGGFVDGKLDWTSVDMGWGGFGNRDFVLHPAIFASRRIAREKYEDVRRVEIRKVKKP